MAPFDKNQSEKLDFGTSAATYAVNVVSQFMHDPRKLHMDAVEKILRYLKSTPGKRILFSNHRNLKVEESCNLED